MGGGTGRRRAGAGGLTPESPPRKRGVGCRGTERRERGEVGRDRIGACLGFAVAGEKVRVRVYGHPTAFQYTAQADVHRLVGPGVQVVGVPTHLMKSGMWKPIFNMWLTGVPDGWTGGVVELSLDSRTLPKHYVLMESAPKAATTYREVGRGRAVPRAEPAAPAPPQDEGGTDEVAVGQAKGDGDDDGMPDGEIK